VQLGLDRMTHGMLPAFNRSAADTRHAPAAALWDETQRAPTDPLAALRRRTLRVTLGGRGTLPEGAQKEVEREASRLEAQLMPTGASLFRDLLQAARGEERGFSGERVVSDAAFTRAWLRAVAYERQASQELARAAWLDTFS
jgi:hypothetical protein